VPRVVEQRYRGSTTTVRVPGVRIEAAVPAPAVAAMAQLAATAGDVPLAEVEQVPAIEEDDQEEEQQQPPAAWPATASDGVTDQPAAGRGRTSTERGPRAVA